MVDCDKQNKNCPPKYKNIGTANFADGKKVTAELLEQFCKNDSYLYKQVMDLWDKTDPEHRKRFYPPYYMDTSKSYGIEPLLTNNDNITNTDLRHRVSDKDILKLKRPNGSISNAYQLSNTLHEKYYVDFDNTNDQTYFELNSNSEYDTLVIEDETIIEDTSTLKLLTADIGTAENPNILHTVLPITTTKEISNEIPFTITDYVKVKNPKYKTIKKKVPIKAKKKKKKDVKKNKKTTKQKNKKKTTKKLTLDAHCSGPYKDWNANSVWYIGYNRHKNYNIKNKWRKNSDTYDIPSICRAQTFKAKHNGELKKVAFKMRGSSKSASPCIVEIRTVTKKGYPSKKVLARTEQKFNHSTSSMVNFIFKDPCEVKKGKKYAIVLRSPLSNFNHCYWLVGWAHTCFSNNRKRAYYDGETFLSENNGKTWIKHGTREKCYGSHYYDWGFAEAPVNFGFEVYIGPKSGHKQKAKKPSKKKKKYKTVKVGNGQPKTIIVPQVKKTTRTAAVTIEYFAAGDYYLEFKPFAGNFYTGIQCIYDIEPETMGLGTYTWEIWNNKEEEWETFDEFSLGSGSVTEVGASSNTSYNLTFNNAFTFVKVRLHLTLDRNIMNFSKVDDFRNDFQNQVATIMALNDTNASDKHTMVVNQTALNNWMNTVKKNFAWDGSDGNETPFNIRKLKSVEFNLFKKPSFKGYLRTLPYYPSQDAMLPACIWSEVDVDAETKGNGDCRIDIVHDKTAIDRVKLLKADNLELRPYIVDFNTSKGISVGVNEYITSEDILAFIFSNSDSDSDKEYNVEFVEWLQKQSPKVYLLPYEDKSKPVTDESGNVIYMMDDNDNYLNKDGQITTNEDEYVPCDYEDIFFYDDWDMDNAVIALDHYPAYPLNSCSIGTEDIQLNLKDSLNDINTFKKITGSANTFKYVHPESLEGNVDEITLSYQYPSSTVEDSAVIVDEDEVEAEYHMEEDNLDQITNMDMEVNVVELDKGYYENTNIVKNTSHMKRDEYDYYVHENEIVFTLNHTNENGDVVKHKINDFIEGNGSSFNIKDTIITTTVTENNAQLTIDDPSQLEMIISKKGYDYTEFKDYIVNYDDKKMVFYNPWALTEGELKINYNPLWVRNLTIEDFPLKMDLWTEYYYVRQDDDGFFFDKVPLNSCGKPDYQNASNNGKKYIVTSVPPLDNIRRLELQDFEGNSLTPEPLVEDEDYYVDYLENKITITYPLNNNENVLNGECGIMVKYTPNLTDTGLSLAYRLRRPIYDLNGNDITNSIDYRETVLDKTSWVNNDIEYGDNIFCLSNYFTTRT